jgi:hypothetical protein
MWRRPPRQVWRPAGQGQSEFWHRMSTAGSSPPPLEGVYQELHGHGYNLSLFNLGGHSRNRDRPFSRTMVQKQGLQS